MYVFIVISVSLLAALWVVVKGYEELSRKYKELSDDFSKQTALITNQQARIQHLAELDTRHTEKLANDKTEIDVLRADVAAARRKLRIQATCPVRETPASGSVGNAGDPQLTEAARQDYYRLREMMAENERQTKYLQDYIKTQCQ
ncbi:lysis protein [Xenorhabdus sp. Sc-CR9]|uniref:lysis protein n=1 Tax=Xenorhabdus sp. Sc-CR9 TaxID=2584468 RepID=UPI001F1B8035|nr:lysis protein [Xenorhabdus sp. Sc-CR9]